MASVGPARSLTCEVCSRKFGRYEHLQRHARTHTKEKPYVCHCGRSFTRKDLLTRHERLNHAPSVPRSPSTANAGRSPVTTTSSDCQHEEPQSGAARSFPHDYGRSCPDDRTSGGLFLASEDDPMFDFARLLNDPEINLVYGSFLVDPVLNHQGLPLMDNIISPPSTTLSPIVAPPIPDGNHGDDDFRELKPVRCPWLMPEAHRLQLHDTVNQFSSVLPSFVFPSRLAIARYVSGYVDGFSHHHPFVHIPTLQLLSYLKTPELILALLAIGAQFRYETKTGLSLYQAARAIMLERMRRGDFFFPCQDPPGESPGIEASPGNALSNHEWMHRVRALLLLFVYASWQNKPDLIQQAFEYQGLIARCLRAIGVSENSSTADENWTEWARNETDRRTKLFAWCLLNLHGIAFDTPPVLLSRELNLFLPSSCKEWAARNEAEWKSARSHAPERAMFRKAHSLHLVADVEDSALSSPLSLSPMGNYILIHALIQRIYLTQQLSQDPYTQTLAPPEIANFERALNRWRHTWCTSPESTLDLHNPYGSLSFTSTALLGIAHIRLHCNLGQWRDLQSCNPDIIAATLQEAPRPQRGPQTIYAALHAVHALNIPVQIGLSYYAQCKSYAWSIQHALCNIECAAFLSKWLLAISATCASRSLSDPETQIIEWIHRVVREALLSHDDTIALLPEISDPAVNVRDPRAMTQKLSYAVVKVWAQMFKLCNSPWPVVRLIGRSLERYAELIRGAWEMDLVSG